MKYARALAIAAATAALSLGTGTVAQADKPGAEPCAKQEQQVTKAQQALANNATFQAIASPSNAQNAAQVQALTKQCNGIIRLLLGLLDTTAGT